MTGSGSIIGLQIASAPLDFATFQQEFSDPESTGDVTIDIVESGERSGGRFLQTRFDGTDNPLLTSREVAWLDDNVLIFAYAFGEPLSDIDLDTVQQRLDDQLANIITTALT